MYTLEDMQGLKIRMPGAFGKVMAKVGAAPLSIPLSEAYTAVATGVADAAGMGSIQFESNSFYEICKYFYVPYMGTPGLMEVIIDMDAWNALPDDLKAILQTAQVEESKENFLGEMKMLDEMLAKFDDWGVTTITLSDEDVATLREAGTSLMEEAAAISPRMAKAVELTQNYQRLLGYID